MKIYSNTLFQNPNYGINSSFKSKTTNKKREEYQKYIEKREYIQAKTQDLFNAMGLLLIISLMTKATDVDFSKKLKTSEKIGVASLIACFPMLVAFCIKQYNLSKEYDKEMNKERV